MNDAGGVLVSVRADARQLVAPDYAVLEGLIEHTAGSRAQALSSVSASLDRLTADLAALGGVAFDESTDRSPLTWSAHSLSAREEKYPDKDTGRLVGSGQVSATVAVRVTVRDLDVLGDLSGVLAGHPGLDVQFVGWQVDWDNPAWPRVRAAAIAAAIGKARDYAAALGATVRHVEHVADTGLLGGDTAPVQPARALAARAPILSGGMEQPGTSLITTTAPAVRSSWTWPRLARATPAGARATCRCGGAGSGWVR